MKGDRAGEIAHDTTRAAFWVLLGLLGLAWLIWAHKVWVQIPMSTDFDTYYRTSERLRAGVPLNEIYNLAADGRGPYRYMPLTLPYFYFVAALPLREARMLWFLVQSGCFFAGFLLLARVLARLPMVADVAEIALDARDPRSMSRAGVAPAASEASRAGVAPAASEAKSPGNVILGPGEKLSRFAGSRLSPAWVVLLCAVLTARFILDGLYAGQVLGFIFLGFCIGFYGWMRGRLRLGAVGVAVAASLKLAPGALLLLFFLKGDRRVRAFLFAAATVVVAISIWIVPRELWTGWLEVIEQSGGYIDYHYFRIQSIKAFLHRLAYPGLVTSAGLFAPVVADRIYAVLALAGVFAVSVFWWWWRDPGVHALNREAITARLSVFAMGIFPYLCLMPETYKHTLVFSVFLIVPLFVARAWRTLAVIAVVFLGSAPDLIGVHGHVAVMNLSLPLIVILYAVSANVVLARRS